MTGKILDFIGENFNTSRRIKSASPRVKQQDGQTMLTYVNLAGEDAALDITDIYPSDAKELRRYQIPHVAHAIRTKDMDYLAWVIQRQTQMGANIIDICIDEIAIDPEERHEWMRWLIPVAQDLAGTTLAIDSSDPETIVAGLEVYDKSKSRPAINSVNLKDGRQVLIDLAREHNALLFANASGRDGMPEDDREESKTWNRS